MNSNITLSSIDSPADLKMVPTEDLPRLCDEMRSLIIDTVSRNGGHLAPSLGVVELTTALHRVFDSPADKIIWDVGHQSYAHKILTGRREEFATLRKEGGLSGFPKMGESEHDVFETGHASTSISAAVGVACSMRAKGEEGRAIAVIGDGSMTNGLAFEAMNHAGQRLGNLMVVLNDNEMSISPSVGALSKFFSKRIHGGRASRLRRRVRHSLSHIPVIGKMIYGLAQRAEETTVSLLTPGFLFEAFGFDYIGPLDGHDLDELLEVFDDVKSSAVGDKPLLVHVLTKKGKGYSHAEERSTSFHGVGPFDRETGEVKPGAGKTYTHAFGRALIDVALDDERVIGITAAMTTGTGMERFAGMFPDRFFDVGMAESHAVTFAAGLATQGRRPVVAIYSTFLQRAYDQILHDVCMQNLPVTLALDRAGLVGDDGPTHHGCFDISFLRSMPNMTIAVPRDAIAMKEMLAMAVESKSPFAIRYPRGAIPPCGDMSRREPLAMGRAEVVFGDRDAELSIWALGNLVGEAIEAANKLRTEGVRAMVVDARFVKPFDIELFRTVANRCRNVLTVEENALSGGFGSMVGEEARRNGIDDISLKCLGIPDRFIEHASQARQREICGIDATGIAEAARGMLDVAVANRTSPPALEVNKDEYSFR